MPESIIGHSIIFHFFDGVEFQSNMRSETQQLSYKINHRRSLQQTARSDGESQRSECGRRKSETRSDLRRSQGVAATATDLSVCSQWRNGEARREEAPLYTWPILGEERRREHTAGGEGGENSLGKTRRSGMFTCSGPTDAKLDLPRSWIERSKLQLPQGQIVDITNSLFVAGKKSQEQKFPNDAFDFCTDLMLN